MISGFRACLLALSVLGIPINDTIQQCFVGCAYAVDKNIDDASKALDDLTYNVILNIDRLRKVKGTDTLASHFFKRHAAINGVRIGECEDDEEPPTLIDIPGNTIKDAANTIIDIKEAAISQLKKYDNIEAKHLGLDKVKYTIRFNGKRLTFKKVIEKKVYEKDGSEEQRLIGIVFIFNEIKKSVETIYPIGGIGDDSIYVAQCEKKGKFSKKQKSEYRPKEGWTHNCFAKKEASAAGRTEKRR